MNGDFFSDKKNFVPTVIFLAAILLSLSYSFYFRIQPSVDARAYDSIAWNLASGNGYRESSDVPILEDNSILRVGPGFEAFLAAIFFVFGHNYAAVWVAHAILHAATAALVYLSAVMIFQSSDNKEKIGLLSASIIAFSPDLITMSGMLMSETLGVFLVALAIFLFFRSVDGEDISIPGIFLAGISFGAAALVRTPSMLLFLPAAGYLISRDRMRHLAVFFAASALIFSPWIIRNFIIYRTFIPTNLAYGIDLAAGNHPGASGELEPHARNDEAIAQYGKISGTRLLAKEAVIFIFRNPAEFMRITLNRISIYFSFARPTAFWFHLNGASQAATMALSSLYSAVIFLFGFLGIWLCRNKPSGYGDRASWLFYMALMMPLAVIFIIVETRYRFLVYPMMAVFAGLGAQASFSRMIPMRVLIPISSVLILNTAFDVLMNIGRISERIGLLRF